MAEVLEAAPAAKRKYPVIRIRPDSPVPGIAQMIVSSIGDDERITLRVIGAGALNQGIKGIIQARQQLWSKGMDLTLRPDFTTVSGSDGGEVTAIVLHCVLQ